MNFNNIIPAVAKFAPLLGSVLAGPGGNAIGQIIAAKFGVDSDDNDADNKLAQAMLSPDAQAKLLEIQSDNFVELTRIKLNDVANARSREVELAKSGHQDTTPRNLAYLTTFGFFLCVFAFFFSSPAEPVKEVLMLLMGVLGTNVTTIISYYFGSSESSRSKDRTIANMVSL